MFGQFETTLFYGLLLGAVSLLAGFTGYTIKQSNEDLMTYLNAVSTGVILSAAFTHLLPDAISDLSEFEYPVATACALAGFLLLVIVETIMQQIQFTMEHKAAIEEHLEHDCADHNYQEGATPVHQNVGSFPSGAFSKLQQQVRLDSSTAYCDTAEKMISLSPKHTTSGNSLPRSPLHTKYSRVKQIGENERSRLTDHSHGHFHNHSHSHSHAHDHSFGGDGNDLGGKKSISFSSAITLWAALMVHSTLEGFGVGVTSSVEQLTIVFAILIHKGFESIALSSALLDSGMSWHLYIVLYLVFCLTIPAGALLGSLLRSGSGSSTFAGIVTALAAGSFM
jgi:zinc transporter ZupT